MDNTTDIGRINYESYIKSYSLANPSRAKAYPTWISLTEQVKSFWTDAALEVFEESGREYAYLRKLHNPESPESPEERSERIGRVAYETFHNLQIELLNDNHLRKQYQNEHAPWVDLLEKYKNVWILVARTSEDDNPFKEKVRPESERTPPLTIGEKLAPREGPKDLHTPANLDLKIGETRIPGPESFKDLVGVVKENLQKIDFKENADQFIKENLE